MGCRPGTPPPTQPRVNFNRNSLCWLPRSSRCFSVVATGSRVPQGAADFVVWERGLCLLGDLAHAGASEKPTAGLDLERASPPSTDLARCGHDARPPRARLLLLEARCADWDHRVGAANGRATRPAAADRHGLRVRRPHSRKPRGRWRVRTPASDARGRLLPTSHNSEPFGAAGLTGTCLAPARSPNSGSSRPCKNLDKARRAS